MSRGDQSINLLRVQSALSNEEAVFLARFRLMSTVLTVIVLIIGFLVGTSYFAATLRLNSVTNDKSNALKILSFNSKKEALLLALKDRVPLAQAAIKSQYPWDRIIDAVTEIVTPPQLTSLTIDANDTLTIEVILGSLEEMDDLVRKTENLIASKRIKNTHIESLSTSKDGKIQASVSFIPIF
jgi:hypothetical protein